MADLQDFPFVELAQEAIAADSDACHPSICPPERITDETVPANTRAMWVQLRSDTKKDRADRERWPERLREFTNLECLSVNGCTPEFFDALCRLPALRRLSIVRGRISDLGKLQSSRRLTHFYFCGSPKIADLEGLNKVSSLQGLSLIGNFKNVGALDPLRSLSQLVSLKLGANDFAQNTYESFEPIGSLARLRALAIFGTKVHRGGLAPIGQLQNLEYLYLEKNELKNWPVSDYRRLHGRLAKLKGNLIELAATDPDFQRQYGIR
jgi:Leucine-rich repeat (LRR) protein